jgi:prophage regulatory protein
MATTRNTEAAALPSTGYIRQAQLLQFIPISPATLWRWVKSGHFVAPSKLSERVTAWDCGAVQKWMEHHAAANGGCAPETGGR